MLESHTKLAIPEQASGKLYHYSVGLLKGPKMQGTILPGGADWQFIKKDVAQVDARDILQTDDGVLIYLSNRGIRIASQEVLKKLVNGEKVNSGEYYFRTIPVFETSGDTYE